MLNYLLDTHTLIWYIDNYTKIPDTIKTIFHDKRNTFFVSIVSIWEITIKLNHKKTVIRNSIDELYLLIEKSNFILLPIERAHLNTYQHLEQIHKDPFDRLLISTAKSENLTIITSDINIHKYDVDWIW